MLNSSEAADSSTAQWKPLTRNQRRVLGVLIEKSKTTPDSYPMTLNSVKTGSNQKSNRSPQLELSEYDVEDTLEQLRHLGAAIEVHSGGRVPKFKHQAYDWFAVDKPELGVLAELLLRGEQTLGELRARAARMEKSLSGQEELRPILSSLQQKGLLIELTAAGRGQMVTHHLYQQEELERLRQRFDAESPELGAEDDSEAVAQAERVMGTEADSIGSTPSPASSNLAALENQAAVDRRMESLELQVEELRLEVAELKRLIES